MTEGISDTTIVTLVARHIKKSFTTMALVPIFHVGMHVPPRFVHQ